MRPRIERVTIPTGCSTRVYNRRIPDIPFEWHHHPEFELTLTLNSRGLRFIGDHVASYEPNDLVLIPSDLPHTWASREAVDPALPHQAIVVWFDERWARQLAELCPEYRPVADLLNRAGAALSFDSKAADQMLRRLPELLAGSPVTRLHAAIATLVELADANATELATAVKRLTTVRSGPQLGRVLNLLHERYAEPVRIEELSEAGSMSPRTLHRLFLAHFGENVSDYLRKLRIGHACLLLLETDISVSSIALKVGFRNLSNFNRAFQKTRKMTPMDLRRFVKEHGRLPKPADNATTTWHDVSDSERSFILQRDRQRQIPA